MASDDPQPQTTKRRAATSLAEAGVGRGLRWSITAAVVLGVVGVLYVTVASLSSASGSASASSPHKLLAKFQPAKVSASLPAGVFMDDRGRAVSLSDFKGQAVVLNLWATWCAPCVKEMPTLAALQTTFAHAPIKVVALSSDSSSATAKARAFMAQHPPLAFYQDAKFAIPASIQPRTEGFPTTYLYDRSGKLRGIVQGEADWSSPEAKATVETLLK